ncbi:hypothetical protein C1645_805700 [Glomus cerebriforme]|uniref:Uncharacterized protein n=1 Tax=Glomus cerebriforme TaxID=658196 RepID=A0A397T669_9GLOM|nr:hypothetical protein C1645_805700 [Glomus cerebriforme]
MTEYHKFQQKGVGASTGGNENNLNHDDRNLTTSHNNRLCGDSTSHLSPFLPPLPPNNQQELQQGFVNLVPSTPFSPMWQKEPATGKEKNAADLEQLLQSEKTMVIEQPQGGSPFTPLFIDDEQDFFLYRNDHLNLVAPPTPRSLTNSPLTPPEEPRQKLLESFDSDEETEYDTAGFFPSYSSIGRRPFN